MITIRRILPGEADLFKQMRLRSLQEAPYAFPVTYEAALQRSLESWREQAERTARGSDRATFIAFAEDTPVGMAALYRREEEVEAGELLQVWVSPEYRGTRLAWDLMDVIFQWAGENHFGSVIAGVTKANARAVRFYTRYGFSILEETSTGCYLVKEVQRSMPS